MVRLTPLFISGLLLTLSVAARSEPFNDEVPSTICFYTRDAILQRHFQKIESEETSEIESRISWTTPHYLDFVLKLNQRYVFLQKSDNDLSQIEEIRKLVQCEWLVAMQDAQSKTFSIHKESDGTRNSINISQKYSLLKYRDPVLWLQNEMAYDAVVTRVSDSTIELQSWFPIENGAQGLVLRIGENQGAASSPAKAAAIFRVTSTDRRSAKAEIISRRTKVSDIKPGSKAILSKSDR